MERESTANRLKQIMQERNLKQVDILKLALPVCKEYGVKMNKSDISQYVSGKVEPNQEKLVVLGISLNVNESWLMGLDVPPERKEKYEKEDFSPEQAMLDLKISQDMELKEALKKYFSLSDNKKKHIIEMIKLLSQED